MKKILLYGKSSENLLQFLKDRKSLKIVRSTPETVLCSELKENIPEFPRSPSGTA
jgi:hypothetical protein